MRKRRFPNCLSETLLQHWRWLECGSGDDGGALVFSCRFPRAQRTWVKLGQEGGKFSLSCEKLLAALLWDSPSKWGGSELAGTRRQRCIGFQWEFYLRLGDQAWKPDGNIRPWGRSSSSGTWILFFCAFTVLQIVFNFLFYYFKDRALCGDRKN